VQFTPLVNFFDEELGSAYCVGLNYTVRAQPGVPAEQTLLHAKVRLWVIEGKVRLGGASDSLLFMRDQHEALLKGRGEVRSNVVKLR